jgi:hypothetical protein
MWLMMDQIKSKQCHFDVPRFSASLMKKHSVLMIYIDEMPNLHEIGKLCAVHKRTQRRKEGYHSYHVPHHIIFIMIHTFRLSLHSPILLENPCTFFTNTCHTVYNVTIVLFYKEELYISMHHSNKPWFCFPFTGSPHQHLVRVARNNHNLF